MSNVRRLKFYLEVGEGGAFPGDDSGKTFRQFPRSTFASPCPVAMVPLFKKNNNKKYESPHFAKRRTIASRFEDVLARRSPVLFSSQGRQEKALTSGKHLPPGEIWREQAFFFSTFADGRNCWPFSGIGALWSFILFKTFFFFFMMWHKGAWGRLYIKMLYPRSLVFPQAKLTFFFWGGGECFVCVCF